jgi:hypothetical protein
LIIKDASKSNLISGILRVILDGTKAYDCIHPEYLCKALKRFAFSDKFIKCICDFSLNVCGEMGPSWLVCTANSVIFPYQVDIYSAIKNPKSWKRMIWLLIFRLHKVAWILSMVQQWSKKYIL